MHQLKTNKNSKQISLMAESGAFRGCAVDLALP
jgi:hypothetical protein